MTAPHRVYLPPRPAAPAGVTCGRCGEENPLGFDHCTRCRSALFSRVPQQARGVGQFSQVVKCGENMPAVTAYLRRNAYPIGESPERCWRRKRREGAREARRRNGRESRVESKGHGNGRGGEEARRRNGRTGESRKSRVERDGRAAGYGV